MDKSHSSDGYPNTARILPLSEEVQAELGRLAPSWVTVLLVGGSAELRLLAARVLHERSGRKGALQCTDCAHENAETLECRLFGGPMHQRAAECAVEEARNGTLFVATIEQMPLLLQPRFLRFLDEAEHVRVVVAASADLASLVEQQRFRRDLAERLQLAQVLLPVIP
jgi:DNA-binding NtrC family response regulator